VRVCRQVKRRRSRRHGYEFVRGRGDVRERVEDCRGMGDGEEQDGETEQRK
jgi:hypothetical protein